MCCSRYLVALLAFFSYMLHLYELHLTVFVGSVWLWKAFAAKHYIVFMIKPIVQKVLKNETVISLKLQ